MNSLIKLLFAAILLVSIAGIEANAQRFAGGSRSASATAMENQIFKRLISLPYYGVFDHIQYQVDGSTVVLSGSVHSLGTKKSAERVVKRVPGVERVLNNIRELPPSSFDNAIRRQLVREIARSAGLYRYLQEPNPSVRLIVDGGRISLEGYVTYRSDADTMRILASGIPGVFSVRNNLIVTREQIR